MSNFDNIPNDEAQAQEDIKLAGWVKSKVEEIRVQSNRVAFEGIAMTNIAYLVGFDSVYYDPALRQYRATNQGTGFIKRNRIRKNLLLPATQNILARMLKSPPKYEVRPNSMDTTDKEAARLGQEIIDGVWDRQKINEKRISQGMWVLECGHAYGKISWDDELGEPIIDPITEDILGFNGDIRFDVCSAFEIFPDPLAKTFDECAYLIHAKVRTLDYFRLKYPEKGMLVKEEGAWLLSTQFEQRINTLNSAGSSNSNTAAQMKNCAIELAYYEKRSKNHPNGRLIIVANGIVLKNDKLPVGEFPYAKFDDIVIGGKYYAESRITHARPLQDQYNNVLKKRSDFVNRLLVGKYIAARGHGLMPEAVDDQSAEIIEYDVVPGAAEPHAANIPIMPAYAYQETEDIEKSVYDIFGLSEISRGMAPASMPAIGMQVLLEQDETRLGIEVEQQEHAWARIGSLILKYTSKFATDERKLKTKARNGELKVKTFTGKDLNGNFDVSVVRGSTIPNSKVLKRQEIMNLFDRGMYGNPQEPEVRERVLGMLEFGDTTESYRDHALDQAQIQKTIEEIEQGDIPLVNKMDNHQLHIVEKNRYRKSDKFERLDDEKKLLLEEDIQNHLNALLGIVRPDLTQPPDNGPPPEQMIQQLQSQAQEQASGIGLDQNVNEVQNNNNTEGMPSL